MLFAGEFLLANFANERLDRPHHDALEFRVSFDEFGCEIVEQPEHVMDHEHLTIAIGSRPDTNGRYRQSTGNLLGQLRGYSFQNHCKTTRFFYSQSVAQNR